MTPKYKRVLIKLSGEALAGAQGHGLDENVISEVVEQIKAVHDMGVEIALVIGGGNFWRGRQGKQMDTYPRSDRAYYDLSCRTLHFKEGFKPF